MLNKDRNDCGFEHIWIGATTVCDAFRGCGVGAGVGYPPEAVAREATACTSSEAACSSVWIGGEAEPGIGRLNMESIVGRRAAPKGVDRKSAGRSMQIVRDGDTPNNIKHYTTFDPGRYRTTCKESNNIVCKGVTIEVYIHSSIAFHADHYNVSAYLKDDTTKG